MAQDEETVSLENLADDALDNFGTKYEEGKTSTSEVNDANGGEEAPFEGKDSPESPPIPMIEAEANDQDDEEDEEVADEIFRMAGSFGGFTMQEKTQQELAEEAQQQRAQRRSKLPPLMRAARLPRRLRLPTVHTRRWCVRPSCRRTAGCALLCRMGKSLTSPCRRASRRARRSSSARSRQLHET